MSSAAFFSVYAAIISLTGPQCEPYTVELENPFEIRSDSTTHTLDATLDVGMRTDVGVPVAKKTTTCEVMTIAQLRNYGLASPDGFVYKFPGPTLRVRRESAAYTPGDAIRLTLTNSLPVIGDDKCNPSCPPCAGTADDPLCCYDNPATKHPNCFHGDNTTNIHFHGLHVSPQWPQDDVFIEIQPKGAAEGHQSAHGKLGKVYQGSFEYRVNPLGSQVREGTHWYHPHKHGSTAIQVGNGMAGALVVEGPFDDWLAHWFTKSNMPLPKEKVMVVQQVHNLNYYATVPEARATIQSLPLINGVFEPKITMYPGEVQRWRIVAATMEASAQIELDFTSGGGVVVAKQIAMDGAPFSPENYYDQPIMGGGAAFRLSPGNRADFLVKALAPGEHILGYRVFGRVENQGGGGKGQRVNMTREVLGATTTVGLLKVVVAPCPDGETCTPMNLPPTLPPIDTLEPGLRKKQLVFHQDPSTAAGARNNEPIFSIKVDGKERKFDSTCAAISMPLNTTEDWSIAQDQNIPALVAGSPFHVFHIHTNGFQVVENPDWPIARPRTPVWMDSITLPDMTPATATTTAVLNPVKIRQKVTEYTGAFVLHCHFLGHEDRGMMLTVQTTCPGPLRRFGKPDPKGGADSCVAPKMAALPLCK